eukprot:6214065-Pleurochrysis_carterae.AAC.3
MSPDGRTWRHESNGPSSQGLFVCANRVADVHMTFENAVRPWRVLLRYAAKVPFVGVAQWEQCDDKLNADCNLWKKSEERGEQMEARGGDRWSAWSVIGDGRTSSQTRVRACVRDWSAVGGAAHRLVRGQALVAQD